MLALFFVTMPMPRRRHRRLASTRRPIAEAEFVSMMAFKGVSGTTARFLWKALGDYYTEALPIMPDDRLESLIAIDRPMIEGIVNEFWLAMRGSDARPPSLLGPDPSVAELGRHLDLMAGWIRGSA